MGSYGSSRGYHALRYAETTSGISVDNDQGEQITYMHVLLLLVYTDKLNICWLYVHTVQQLESKILQIFLNCQYWQYSRTPFIRPPSESHWCGRIRGMVAREGFRYAALLQQRHTKYGRIRGMVVGEGGRSTGVLLYNQTFH